MKKLFALFMTLCVSVALVGITGCGEPKKEEKKGAAPAAPAKAPGGEEKK